METAFQGEIKLTTANRLIAEFMGYQVINYQHKYEPIYNGNKHAKTIGQEMKLWGGLDLEFTGRFIEDVNYPFDTDFNYLVPVIRQIEEKGFVVMIAGIKYRVYRLLEEDKPIISLVCGDLSKKTKMTYTLIIEFINWYNANNL